MHARAHRHYAVDRAPGMHLSTTHFVQTQTKRSMCYRVDAKAR
jgi:hypothetical protein